MRAAEEFRVNWLCRQAGFAMKAHLADGTEKAVGDRLAEREEWQEAVYFAAACAGTASMNPFLTGIRRHRRDWAPVLRAIEQRLLKEAKKLPVDELASTGIDHGMGASGGLEPRGFRYTEAWAVWLDGLTRKRTDAEESNAEEGEDRPPVTPEQVKDAEVEFNASAWPEVRIGKIPLTRNAPGGLGRKRRAADRGRAPRRIHRLLTDPQRRVFDQHRRGNGGVVLVDGSGSMSLTEDDVRRILAAAPGATVAIYACTSGNEPENLWILADRGRMAESIPDRPAGNGVDLPALAWAIGQRQHRTAPVVWITDGIVHKPRCQYSGRAAMECIDAVIANNVICRPHAASAVRALEDLAARRRPKRWWPPVWQRSWRTLRGTTLRQEIQIDEPPSGTSGPIPPKTRRLWRG
ncbi:MAG: hypothetical protein ACKOBG_03645 [Actinomycetota bacterium]